MDPFPTATEYQNTQAVQLLDLQKRRHLDNSEVEPSHCKEWSKPARQNAKVWYPLNQSTGPSSGSLLSYRSMTYDE